MSGSTWRAPSISLEHVRGDVTGAIGDSLTVLPIVVAVGVLTELHLAVMLIWFGVFQIVWGVVYDAPVSVEPMKALAALLIAGTVTTGEFLVAGVLVSVVLIAIGVTGMLERFDSLVPEPLVRGVQFAVALVLLERGFQLGHSDPVLAGGAVVIALFVIAIGYWNLSALVVLVAGGVVAASQTGVPTVAVPQVDLTPMLSRGVFADSLLTVATLEAALAQVGMSVGNAAVATSLLLAEFYDRDISPDDLSTSMGAMNLFALPLGGLPMCHGSGGVASKYAFGARTATANVILGVIYVGLAFGAVALVTAYPFAMLGVILSLVAIQLARASFATTRYPFVIAVGVIGLLVNIAAAIVVGVILHQLLGGTDRFD